MEVCCSSGRAAQADGRLTDFFLFLSLSQKKRRLLPSCCRFHFPHDWEKNLQKLSVPLSASHGVFSQGIDQHRFKLRSIWKRRQSNTYNSSAYTDSWVSIVCLKNRPVATVCTTAACKLEFHQTLISRSNYGREKALFYFISTNNPCGLMSSLI